MTISRLLSVFAVSLTLAAVAGLLGPGDAQAKIKCNSILGPGGTYVLDRDLTCPQVDTPDDADDRIGVLKVIGGATLNLNGHTVSCDPRYTGPFAQKPWGIVTSQSTVKNGTVRGCGFGIIPSRSVVKGMTLVDNDIGVQLRRKYTSGNNLIFGNKAINNRLGFEMEESKRETLIDNIAQENAVGFFAILSDVVLIGNVALRNQSVGFWTRDSSSARLAGNRAEQNDVGFWIEGVGEITGNIAKNNIGAGFVVDGHYSATRLDRMHDNVARGNGGDGFRLHVSNGAGTLSGNHAINNRGYGLHVVEGRGEALAEPTAMITGNTAIGNGAGDLGDDTDCRFALWVANRFGTAAQPCIH